jgi:hypothetical protein
LNIAEDNLTPLDIRRAAASSVLFTTYALQNHTAANNHWAIFEGWVITGAAILALATKNDTPSAAWSYSFDLSFEQAHSALEALVKECEERNGRYVQGSPFSDGYVYRVRMTVISGLLAALRLSAGTDRHEDTKNSIAFIDGFLLTNYNKLQLWGEGAVPFFILTALGLERRGHHALSERLILQLITTICTVNGKKSSGVGLTNPYWSIEQSLRLLLGLESHNTEEFLGTSYTLQSLVHMLVRRGLKQSLKRLWPLLTTMDFASLVFRDAYEWLAWKAKTAVLDTRPPNQPEHWDTLLNVAEKPDSANFPEVLIARPSFIAFLLLVYPHRCHPALVRCLDQWATSSA